ncbi:MAG: hypothetical protein ACJ8R9_22700 [Steroidobacteraceae bacterium]
MPARISALQWLLIGVVAAVLVVSWATHVTSSPVDKDSAQSVQMAVNLANHGVISLDERAPFTPSDYREPLPVLVTAAGIRLMDVMLGPAEASAYFSGERLKYLKMQNILWLALLTFGVFWAVATVTGSFAAALAALLIGGVVFSANGWASGMLDDLYTDLPAGAVLVLASTTLAVALARGRRSYCVLAGLLFGALTLIKAAVMYVFIGTIGLLLCVFVLYRSRFELRALLRNLAIMILAFICTVGPWMLRNRVELGSFQVAQRAGVVLMVRAVKDLMTREEYVGAFYVWAPQRLQPLLGRLLGFGPADLQRGGRLQHLNRSPDSNFAADDIAAEQAGRPQDAIAYYRRGRAERIKLQHELVAAHVPNTEVATDRLLQQRAMSIIKTHPLQHMAATVPFLWRGATVAFPILALALVLATRRRRYDIALLALPAFGLVMFYALLSHFIPRYSVPVRPVLLALLVIAAQLSWQAFRQRGHRDPSIVMMR